MRPIYTKILHSFSPLVFKNQFKPTKDIKFSLFPQIPQLSTSFMSSSTVSNDHGETKTLDQIKNPRQVVKKLLSELQDEGVGAKVRRSIGR